MRIRKSLSVLLGFFCCLWAGPDYVAEYCASFLNEDSYKVQLVKDLDMPIVEWNYPKTVQCERCRCYANWKAESHIDFPENDMPCGGGLAGLLGGGGGGIGILSHCGLNTPAIVPRLEKVTLQGTQKKCCGENVYRLKNARERLKPLYGTVFGGSWEAKLETNAINKSQLNPMKFDIAAKLVGECDESYPVAEYCVQEGNNLALYNTHIFENLSEMSFSTSDNLYCESITRVEKTLELDFDENEKYVAVHLLEQDSCELTGVVESKINIPMPAYIDLSSLKKKTKIKNLKKYYGALVKGRWNSELQCGHDTITRAVPISIRITGQCEKKSTKVGKSIDHYMYRQLDEQRVHGEYIPSRSCESFEVLQK